MKYAGIKYGYIRLPYKENGVNGFVNALFMYQLHNKTNYMCKKNYKKGGVI